MAMTLTTSEAGTPLWLRVAAPSALRTAHYTCPRHVGSGPETSATDMRRVSAAAAARRGSSKKLRRERGWRSRSARQPAQRALAALPLAA